MRIAELADLAGTTVRTIRYYHQIGLLPVPEHRDGVRDYGMSHLARLVRIRWLTRAGVGLTQIAAMIGDPAPPPAGAAPPDPAPVLADLRATVTAVEEQLQRLRDQRDRLRSLIGAVERDGSLSPMPAAIVRFYDHMHAQAADPQTRRVIRRERDFMELAFYRGDMPPESARAYEGFTEAGLAESSALFGRIADRVRRGGDLDDREIDEIATAVIDRVSRHLGADLPRVTRSIDPEMARRAVELYVRLTEPGEQRVARVIGDAVLTMIEKGRAQ
ncbi:MerR family transcriptional regulator [Paractinoplanes brasiliensis]|uniref:DNA-binding transcriptional MerR regulator n=1 Tax=Paractinoplanes brasiliensis TaxID=52695 RepID=A0A4R6JPN4_9ACTN|nr:MerR family transcriptional regulator [Actinoplanes brasiliensis]TDO38424.1 DNA-binding transcriptional MerR regulator [Actinoplanes brasiliensis]GID26803.1 hypothetical protein Abr02nite_17860 [Actinoplanes brasiliensis]